MISVPFFKNKRDIFLDIFMWEKNRLNSFLTGVKIDFNNARSEKKVICLIFSAESCRSFIYIWLGAIYIHMKNKRTRGGNA